MFPTSLNDPCITQMLSDITSVITFAVTQHPIATVAGLWVAAVLTMFLRALNSDY